MKERDKFDELFDWIEKQEQINKTTAEALKRIEDKLSSLESSLDYLYLPEGDK